ARDEADGGAEGRFVPSLSRDMGTGAASTKDAKVVPPLPFGQQLGVALLDGARQRLVVEAGDRAGIADLAMEESQRTLDARQRAGPIAVRAQALLDTLCQPAVLLADLAVDPVVEIAQHAHLAALVGVAV